MVTIQSGRSKSARLDGDGQQISVTLVYCRAATQCTPSTRALFAGGARLDGVKGNNVTKNRGVRQERIVTSCMTYDMKLDILVSSTWPSESIGGLKRYKSSCKGDTNLLLSGILTT